jgi:predicted RNA-binding Zn-ribbon protein involved in translation (DUF1610 family)
MFTFHTWVPFLLLKAMAIGFFHACSAFFSFFSIACRKLWYSAVMSGNDGVEIHCPGCGRDALLLRTPVYEGFKKTGVQLTCASCGFVFEREEDVPFMRPPVFSVFKEEDREQPVQVFDESLVPFCHRCEHYVVNPFTQWCSVHRKEVLATDSCDQFTLRTAEQA